MAVNRYNFDGFQYRRSQDTDDHEIEIGYVMDGGLVFLVTVMRHMDRIVDPKAFVVADVSRNGETVWSFKKSGFVGTTFLAKAGDALVIALVGQDRKVEDIVPFSRFYSDRQMDMRTKFQLKRGAAEFLSLEYKSSMLERDYVRIANERERIQREAEEKLAAEERDAKRIERLKVIMSRGKVAAYTAEGQLRYGWPVMEAEWPSLSKSSHAILVDRIGEDGSIGNVVEAFVVIKGGGKNPQKGSVAPVTVKRPTALVTAAKRLPIQPLRSTIIEVEGTPYEVSLYETMDAIRKAREAGLNSGTYTAVVAEAGTKIEVYEVHKDNVKTLGHFEALV